MTEKERQRRDPYRDMADRLNAMKPGQAWRIPWHEIADLPSLPDWAFLAPITMGFDRVKESVIGSSFCDVWRFTNEPNGDITAYRVPEKEQPQRRVYESWDLGPVGPEAIPHDTMMEAASPGYTERRNALKKENR